MGSEQKKWMLRLTNIDAIEWLDALVDSEIALLKYKQQDDEIPEQFRKRYVKEQLEQIDACSYVHDPEECPECLKARIKELEETWKEHSPATYDVWWVEARK